LGLLSAIYSLGLSCDKLLTKPNKLPVKVVSIGNLTTGGTGKTPAVMSIALEAKKRGFNPCILTRGYKGKSKDTCFVSKGAGPVLSADEAGDEAFLMAETLRGIPIVKGKNRYDTGLFAIREHFEKQETPTPDPRPSIRVDSDLTPLLILDDGFQHWALKRDIDVVLIDATNPFGNGKLLPEGALREPLSALKRADIIILTKTDTTTKESISHTTKKVAEYNPQAPIFSASHKPVELINVAGDVRQLNTLFNQRIYAFAAIANPVYFQSLLRSHGAQIVQSRDFRDHHSYSQKDMDGLKSDAMGLDIITTEKDLVKLGVLKVPANVYALRIEFSVGGDFHDNLFRRLQ
jgi:tetraacyldisaccharide 4'-kinase